MTPSVSTIFRRWRFLSFVVACLCGTGASRLTAAVWQWSVADGDARAYLWVPPDCQRVRAVVLANHNMIEQGILEHPAMRRTLAELGFAEVWVVPGFDLTFDFNHGAGERAQRVLSALADVSGYTELCVAPVVPMGHSAAATFPWNFAAWQPGRTLAVLSVHGDAPQTTLTGNGHPRIDWGDHTIDGVPGLMVMGEYEWWEARLTPAMDFQAAHPAVPVAFLGDAGHGHFDFSDQLVEFLAMFVRKAAAARLPAVMPAALDAPVPLTPVDPRKGWRVDRWRLDEVPHAPAAPDADYRGDRRESFWCFDEEMARATEAYYVGPRGKAPQLLSVTAPGDDPQGGCGEPVTPRFEPGEDGLTFRLETAFMDAVAGDAKNTNPARWAYHPVGTPLGHATGGGPIQLSLIVGPARQVGPDTFVAGPGRAEYTANHRNFDVWVLARHPGDATCKSIVQQAMVRVSPSTSGAQQHIDFPSIAPQTAGTTSLTLHAKSDAGLPVHYYVREGPAEISGDTLTFTTVPPRAAWPVKITVVAWQWGRRSLPAVQAAEQVEQTIELRRP